MGLRTFRNHLYALSLMLIGSASMTTSAQEIPLTQGRWFRLAVERDGVHEIDYDLLRKMGIDPDRVPPTAFRIFAYPTGMLPQANATARPAGLTEIRIHVSGAEDGKFNRRDKIYFFGQGPDRIGFDRNTDFFTYENNLYSERNHYYLTVDNGFGARMAVLPTLTTGTIVFTYRDLYLYDTDKVNILRSGREWFGLDFDANTIAELEWTMDQTLTGQPVRIATRLEASAYDPASFQVSYNGQVIGNLPLAAIPATSYGLKGRTRNDTVTASASDDRHRLKLEYIRGGDNYSVGRLDRVLASVPRKLTFDGKSFLFFNTDTNLLECMLDITSDIPMTVWDVTDPFQTARQGVLRFGSSFRFTTDGSGPTVRRFAVFDTTRTQIKPIFTGLASNRDLRSENRADLLIVTHPDFSADAERLAAHRRQHDGLDVTVTTTQEIYDGFSGGRQDVSAIRDYIRHIHQAGGRKLQFVLLFGKGSYDYRNLTTSASSFVPVYQSRQSLSPLETYSSDDFYGFLEDQEGDWGEAPAQFHSLDVGVGRIPCTTREEARAAVDKLIDYDTDSRHRGDWRKELVFVADDGDNNIHQSQAEALALWIEERAHEVRVNRLYLDDFEQVIKPFGQITPQGSGALQRAMHEGAAIINYTGHGSEQLWTAERMLAPESIQKLNNRNRLPFLVTATCEFGRADDPAGQSSGEKLVLKKDGGAIGLVTTSRPVSSATNFQINQDFYSALFSRGQHRQYQRIGSVFRNTKNARNSGLANRNFSLLGDPSMRIGLPQADAVLTGLSSASGSSDLEGSATVTLSGEIRNGDSRWAGWDGTVQIEFLGPPVTRLTRGDENEPFGYTSRSNAIWKGELPVRDGAFTAEFNLPGDLTDVPTTGKVMLHGVSSNGLLDAGGLLEPLDISPVNRTLTDNQQPAIRLFANDSSFQDGGIVGTDPLIVAYLTDDTGIDLTGLPGREIRLVLDGDSVFFVSGRAEQYFDAASGPARYALSFQLFDLPAGPHEVTLYAMDLAGKTSTATLRFVVNGESLETEDLFGYPNPFDGTTSIRFRHTSPGEDLDGSLMILTPAGHVVRHIDFSQEQSPAQVEIMIWDGTDANGNKIPPGIYLIRMDVRSARTGVKKQTFGKLILSN